MPRTFVAVLAVVACTSTSGCISSWRDAAAAMPGAAWNRFKPSAPPPSPEAVVLQYIRIDRPVGNAALNDEIWRQADEQFLTGKLKTDLAKNGFRAAKITGQLPPPLLKLLDKSNKQNEGRSHQTVAGNAVKIQATEVIERCNLFYVQDDSPKGETREKAQGYWSVVPTLSPNNRVKLSIAPLVEYGEQIRIPTVSADLSGIQLRAERQERNFPELQIEIDMGPNECLLLGCFADMKGTLGQTYLTKGERTGAVQSVILMRTMRPTRDDLFTAGYEVNDFFLTPEQGGAASARSPVRATVQSSAIAR